jgi:hypothetical protein
MALPATGITITMGTVRNYFGLTGTITLSTLGAFISPSVTTEIKLSATFGGWQNPNSTGASPT